jgi:drug/metabolite transporter (DMT)-like permease
MQTKLWAVLTVVFTTLLTSIGQILYKKAADQLVLTPLGLLTNVYLIVGVMVYAIAGILVIIALRGGEVSVLYPIIATSYIWVAFLSMYFLNENMNPWKWLGISTIFFGIVVIGIGSKGEKSPVVLEV